MSLRGNYVVVDPASWDGDIHDLARRLVPIIGQPSSQIVRRLNAGLLTIESDLTLQSAETLQNKLLGLGVESTIRNGGDSDAHLTDLELLLDELQEGPIRSPQPEHKMRRSTVPGLAFGREDVEVRPQTAKWRRLTADHRAADENRNNASTERDSDADTDNASAWGEIFPELASTPRGANEPATSAPEWSDVPPKSVQPELNQPEPIPPSLDELEGVVSKPDIPRGPAVPASVFAEQIVGQESQKPPYAPDGFEDSYEHATSVAVALAVIAPGAGHVYNGDDSRATGIVLRSLLIKPYFDSIREARHHAERIRTYYKPKPEPGSFRRALTHAFVVWLSVAALAAASLYVVSNLSVETLEKRTDTVTPIMIRNAYSGARLRVLEARLAAVTAGRLERENEVRPTLSMTNEERVRRLYAVGVEQCRQNNHGACAAIMKRVVKIDPLYGSALQLQTWASQQLTAKTPIPMPDVGEVSTLSELEKLELNTELPEVSDP